MPRPDQPPALPGLRRRFVRAMGWMALFSAAIAGIAVLIVARGDTSVHVHMLVATALGVGLTVLLGTGLMTLAFLSNSSGHDADAADHQEHHDPGP